MNKFICFFIFQIIFLPFVASSIFLLPSKWQLFFHQIFPFDAAVNQPKDECHICIYVVTQVQPNFVNGNITTQIQLLRELEHECIKLSNLNGDLVTFLCLNIIRNGIDQIYIDLKAQKQPAEICGDIERCPKV